ncbi:hypothetical protein V8D89_004645 [Ganoderma adspersum]
MRLPSAARAREAFTLVVLTSTARRVRVACLSICLSVCLSVNPRLAPSLTKSRSMRLPANRCQAIPADPRCPHRARASSSFCTEHAEELRALEGREQTAAREAGRLKPIVDEMLAEGTKAYNTVREARKDERVGRLYLELLGRQIDAAVVLKARFVSQAEDRGLESLAVLEERKGCVEAFLAALQARADDIEHDQAVAAEPAATAADPDEPPAYPILEVPHPPCACRAGTSDNRPHAAGGPPGRCTALRPRDGERCTWTCAAGQRFCLIWHCVGHSTAVISHQLEEEMLEDQRKRVALGKGGEACRVRDVKNYIRKLEEVVTIVEEHQRLFSCRTPDGHSALLTDFKMRRTAAVLLLGELSGRADAKTAEKQGQAEPWATEYLAEVKRKDATERREAAEDLLMGAIVGGAAMWLGVPWARSVIAGVVTSCVVRSARESTDKS